jgi:hypothetical protein
VRDAFGEADFINVIETIKEEAGDQPLAHNQLQIVVALLQKLTGGAQKFSIFVPDETCRLKKAGELLYNDAPWMPQGMVHIFYSTPLLFHVLLFFTLFFLILC